MLADVYVAKSLLERVFGLTIAKPLKENQCFLIRGCRSIHTVGMRYSLDAVFLDKEGRVIKVYSNLRPFRFTPFIKKAAHVVEFRAGFAYRNNITEGLCLSFA